jgi:hypothetical protein
MADINSLQRECGRRMRNLAAIEQMEFARAILDSPALRSRAPPLAPVLSLESPDLDLGFEEPSPEDAR